jgi:hypothetical protein
VIIVGGFSPLPTLSDLLVDDDLGSIGVVVAVMKKDQQLLYRHL